MRAFQILAVVAAFVASATPSTSEPIITYGAIAFGVKLGNTDAALGIAYDQKTIEAATKKALETCQEKAGSYCVVKAQWRSPGCGFATFGEVLQKGKRTGFYYTQAGNASSALSSCKEGGAVNCLPPVGGCSGPQSAASN